MMHVPDHERVVAEQFGPRAGAYVMSAVHATGEDLEQLGAIARALAPVRALDLGCGGGHAAFAIAPHAHEVVAYDLSPEMLAAVGETAERRRITNVVTCEGSVAALPFDHAAFDLVASRYSAHHWDDLLAGLREARRVLRPNGRAVFIDVASPAPAILGTHLQAIELLRDPSHVRNYSAEEWVTALRTAGFVTAAPVTRRLRLDFASWVARMQTPPEHVAAIHSLQRGAPRSVTAHFAIEEDGTFTVDTVTIEATPL
jgi:ubiquinone/menaquinone biosynthesis C-methylase UbiE